MTPRIGSRSPAAAVPLRETMRRVIGHPRLAGFVATFALLSAVVAVFVARQPAGARNVPTITAPPPAVLIGRHAERVGPGPQRVTVTLNPITGAATSILGAPVVALLDPRTGRILSLTAKPGRAPRMSDARRS